MGVNSVYLTGYTPYPKTIDDDRMPHLAAKIDRQITKTALGAEKTVMWQHGNIETNLDELQGKGFQIVALEQVKGAVLLPDYKPAPKVAIIVGREVEGLEAEIIDKAHQIVEIPMLGKKESLNVVQAAAMVLYHCRYV